MLKFLAALFFVLCLHFTADAQWALGAEYKYHPKESQVGLRYDNLVQLNSSFNFGIHLNLAKGKGWGVSAGWNYHFENTFTSSLTTGVTGSINFSTSKPRSTYLDVSANLGYFGLAGDTKHVLLWPKVFGGYRFDLKSDEEESGDAALNGFMIKPSMQLGYRF